MVPGGPMSASEPSGPSPPRTEGPSLQGSPSCDSPAMVPAGPGRSPGSAAPGVFLAALPGSAEISNSLAKYAR